MLIRLASLVGCFLLAKPDKSEHEASVASEVK